VTKLWSPKSIKIFRPLIGVIDALIADDNPWSLTPDSKKVIHDVILAARQCYGY